MSIENFDGSCPQRPVISEELLHDIDIRSSIAAQKLSELISKKDGIEPVVANYTPLKLPFRISVSIDDIVENFSKTNQKYSNADEDTAPLRHGLIAGFIFGRRMVKRLNYPRMTSVQLEGLTGLDRLVSEFGYDIEGSISRKDAFGGIVRRKLELADIHEKAYPDDKYVFRTELFMKAASYMGASALAFVIAEETRNLDRQTEAYFLANANKLSREVKEEHAGRRKPTPMTHLL